MTVSRETSESGEGTLTPEQFSALVPVSRETLARLKLYANLLVKWQAAINLVGAATLGDRWRRHFLDSAQLYPYLPSGPVVDLGSGAGFPGLVLAILRAGAGNENAVHLVESDARKCAFLREAARITEAPVILHTERIETVAPFVAAAITARALAPMERLLALAAPFVGPATELLFLKGRGGEEELTQAAKDWTMTVQRRTSLSDPSGVLFHLKEVYRGRD